MILFLLHRFTMTFFESSAVFHRFRGRFIISGTDLGLFSVAICLCMKPMISGSVHCVFISLRNNTSVALMVVG
jgi:hypothetical protein